MMNTQTIKRGLVTMLFLIFLTSFLPLSLNGQVRFESETRITDLGLHFDGNKVGRNASNSSSGYDYFFGPRISAHGDCIKKHKEFIFMTWYKGGKYNRHVMLSRLNTKTGVIKTIEFPHTHTGLNGSWWIGESHNTIAVGISPKDGTIHMLYDMHSYANSGMFKDDYFRYAHSKKNAATVPDSEFNLGLFIKDNQGDYTHVSLNGTADPAQFQDLTYPRFFLNDGGDLLMHMRVGGNNNGAYVFSKYNASTSKWDKLTQFNKLNSKSSGEDYNWGLYGSMKYVNGKLRVGFQKRSANNNDKYEYQNGFYYGYSDDQSGRSQWKDHTGKAINIPFSNAELLKISEPGNLVSATGKNEVYIVGGFDWTVTDRGDVHFIGKVKDRKNNITRNVHTYKPAGSSKFITSTDFMGGEEIYTYGNDIYLIGLNRNRIFIEKSEGGKNNFKRIYTQTSGRSFSHGVPYITDGKLYYYLMENSSGDKRPLFLQVIDLGLTDEKTNIAPTVVLTNPSESSYTEGSNLSVELKANDQDGSITKLEVFVNGNLVDTDGANYTPHLMENIKEGSYTIKVVVTDNEGAKGEAQKSFTVKVPEPANNPPTLSFVTPSLNTVLSEGYTAFDVEVEAIDADGSVSNVKLYVDGEFIRQESVAPFTWGIGNNESELLGLSVGEHVLKAEATDDDGAVSIKYLKFNVQSKQQSPVVSFVNPMSDLTVYEGYNLMITAEATDSDGSINQLNLYIDNTFVRQENIAPYEWGHEGSPNPQELNGLTGGSHTIKVVATDNDGNKSQDTFTLTVLAKSDDGSNLCKFGTPSASGIPALNNVSFSYLHKLGQGGPSMDNFREFSINWDPTYNGLYQFAINTDNGVPGWYINFSETMSYQLKGSNPEVTLKNTGIAGLDGSYWVIMDGDNFVMVSKGRDFTLYFSNSSLSPDCGGSNLRTTQITINEPKVYPNPTSGIINIDNLPDFNFIKIYDYQGVEVLYLESEQNQTSSTIDVSVLPEGTYFIKVYTIKDEVIQLNFIKN
ncbi:T9SS type A sorting domain-containing protein [Marinigracilibium pacificum]|uniref:T9SS type A sorting domain-containing protein n=1 Tax=Marinigracilibium pacificum TaxID=2729599 RepID=A0A848J0R4_9BACT|nr:Ig-like domain-containing protein [Marinigracilibium pacificum]NMM50383.1 T9SS type A sorting domain-containing protein [Marinigracilibium pacificum]